MAIMTHRIISRGLARFALAQKTSEQIQEEHLVSDADLPVGPGELEETDHCAQVLDGLWQDLRAQYENSPSSGDPPFPVLTIPASADPGNNVSVPPLSAEAGTFIPLSPLPEDDTTPPPDDVAARPDTFPPPAKTDDDLAQPPACDSDVEPLGRHLTSSAHPLKTRFVAPAHRPAVTTLNAPATVPPGPPGTVPRQSSAAFRSVTNVAHPQPPPQRRTCFLHASAELH